jgi:hypothetical protein
MKISAITGFTFTVLILDLLIYGIFYDVQKHGYVPSRFISQYLNFMGLFLDMAIIIVVLLILALAKDILTGIEWKT